MHALADRPLVEVYPALANLGIRPSDREIKNYSLAGIVNSTHESAYTVHSLVLAGKQIDLRLKGLGDNATFSWVGTNGDQIGDAFQHLTAYEIERLRLIVEGDRHV